MRGVHQAIERRVRAMRGKRASAVAPGVIDAMKRRRAPRSAQLRPGQRCEQRPALEFLEVSAPIGRREVARLCFRRNALYGLICHDDGLPDDNADCTAGATSTVV